MAPALQRSVFVSHQAVNVTVCSNRKSVNPKLQFTWTLLILQPNQNKPYFSAPIGFCCCLQISCRKKQLLIVVIFLVICAVIIDPLYNGFTNASSLGDQAIPSFSLDCIWKWNNLSFAWPWLDAKRWRAIIKWNVIKCYSLKNWMGMEHFLGSK